MGTINPEKHTRYYSGDAVVGMEIYYFSGSGNSLHVAQELQQRLFDAELVPIVRCLEQDVVPEADAVGLVFPINSLTLLFPFDGSSEHSPQPPGSTCSPSRHGRRRRIGRSRRSIEP